MRGWFTLNHSYQATDGQKPFSVASVPDNVPVQGLYWTRKFYAKHLSCVMNTALEGERREIRTKARQYTSLVFHLILQKQVYHADVFLQKGFIHRRIPPGGFKNILPWGWHFVALEMKKSLLVLILILTGKKKKSLMYKTECQFKTF